MPRIPRLLIHRATSESRYLSHLLRECRDLTSARNELRWLREHVAEVYALNDDRRPPTTSLANGSAEGRHQFQLSKSKLLNSYVRRRSRGEPLQYIFGNQPFGDLEILCRKRVLIPRTDTETYVRGICFLLHQLLAQQDPSDRQSLRVLDLCTGSGCIALLVHSLLRPPNDASPSGTSIVPTLDKLRVVGIDISDDALRLSNDSLHHNRVLHTLHESAATEISFHKANILELRGRVKGDLGSAAKSLATLINLNLNQTSPTSHEWDVVFSNPPYISPSNYAPGGTTARSVRVYEPRLALVPDKDDSAVSSSTDSDSDQADRFYHHILNIGFSANAKLIVMEIGDSDQAARISRLAISSMSVDQHENMVCEIWNDDGVAREASQVAHRGAVSDRAVVLWRGEWAAWRKTERVIVDAYQS